VGLAIGFRILLLLRPEAGLQVISVIFPVAVAFNSTLLPSLMVLFPPAFAVGDGLTVIVMLLLAAMPGTEQAALLVITQLTTSPLAIEVLLKVALSGPASIPLICHWYAGALPPFVEVAVNVTGEPKQILFADVAMLTAGVTGGETFMVMLLLVA